MLGQQAEMFAFFKAFFAVAPKAKVQSLSVAAVTSDREFASRLQKAAQAEGWHLDLHQNCEAALRAKGDARVLIYDWRKNDEDWRPALKILKGGHYSRCVLLASPVIDSNLRDEAVRFGGFDVFARSGSLDSIVHAVRFAWFATRHSQPGTPHQENS